MNEDTERTVYNDFISILVRDIQFSTRPPETTTARGVCEPTNGQTVRQSGSGAGPYGTSNVLLG